MTGTFDINLTPDKRTILLHEEQSLIKELSVPSLNDFANIEDQLTQFFDLFQHNLPLGQFLTSTKPRQTQLIKAESPQPKGGQELTQEDDQDNEFGTPRTPQQQQPQIIDLSSTEKIVSSVTGDFKERIATYALDSPDRVKSIDSSLTPVPEITIVQPSPSKRSRHPLPQRRQSPVSEEDEISDESDIDEAPARPTSRNVKRPITTIITPSQLEAIVGPSKRGRREEQIVPRLSGQTLLQDHFLRKADASDIRGRRGDVEFLEVLSPEQISSMFATVNTDEDKEMIQDEASPMPDHKGDEMQEGDVMVEDDMEEVENNNNDVPVPPKPVEPPSQPERNLFKSRQKNAVHNLRTTADITLDSIESQYTTLKISRQSSSSSRRGTIGEKEYTEPNEKAEERLSLTVSKEDFSRMRIVGQFNLGFIIAVRERRMDSIDVEDVFIIDQHASDEKYNFERLEAESVMQVQTLAR